MASCARDEQDEVETSPSFAEHSSTKISKFRFKSKKRLSDKRIIEDDRGESDMPRHHHNRHHHRKRRKCGSPRPLDGLSQPDSHHPNPSSQFFDSEAAFRESLFDAMADDEGAQYWEGVYGQPIHIYSNIKEDPEGELERMTDEEYAAYVRAKMYEKTHQHLIEEKAKREAAKKEKDRLAKEGREAEREADEFRKQIEESLRRGRERKSRKAWSDNWEIYLKKWAALVEGQSEKITVTAIPWPVESGNYRDVNAAEVERFLLYASSSGKPTETQLGKVLKLERIRWHPDKVQQRLAGQHIEEPVIQQVTAVFQIIDRLWSELRDKK